MRKNSTMGARGRYQVAGVSSKAATKPSAGFSILELLVVVAIMMIVMAVTVPSFMAMVQNYKLSSAVEDLSAVIKFTRYEAIRLNTPITCRTQVVAGTTTVWSDSNPKNGALDPTEKRVVFTGNVNLVAAGAVAGNAALATATNIPALTAVSPATGTFTFDARGAVTGAAVYVLYVGNTGAPNAGYRALILLPSGSVETWKGDTTAAGHWVRLY
jgi:Tfp pilus assembly protein FimT